jgi:structural maintenance of chromosomes protein 6
MREIDKAIDGHKEEVDRLKEQINEQKILSKETTKQLLGLAADFTVMIYTIDYCFHRHKKLL